MRDFSIHCRWESALHEAPEIRETSAMLKIALGGVAVTRNEDGWSRTVCEEARLSAYPLALWFASSWWRLRWESLPPAKPSHSWRMAHELAAAGHGYVWPSMAFVSDGENMQIWAVQSDAGSKSAVRYLANACQEIPVADFEQGLDEFIEDVLARLEAVGLESSMLRDLWNEIGEERKDAEACAYRRLEAMLGFEPDECPGDLHGQFSKLIPRAGKSAIDEIATLCASSDSAEKLQEIVAFAESKGLEGRIDISMEEGDSAAGRYIPPWRRGWDLARRMRERLGLNEAAVTNERLCEWLGLQVEKAIYGKSETRPLLSMAMREPESKRIKFLPRSRNEPGRRFELARLLCDYHWADKTDAWLPATSATTARQKIQRAFAAEFLCPIAALRERLDGAYASDDIIDDAAEYFRVSPEAVKTQLLNHDLAPPSLLVEYGNPVRFGFPYDCNL
jgi:hypothetical protein